MRFSSHLAWFKHLSITHSLYKSEPTVTISTWNYYWTSWCSVEGRGTGFQTSKEKILTFKPSNGSNFRRSCLNAILLLLACHSIGSLDPYNLKEVILDDWQSWSAWWASFKENSYCRLHRLALNTKYNVDVAWISPLRTENKYSWVSQKNQFHRVRNGLSTIPYWFRIPLQSLDGIRMARPSRGR